MSEVNVTIQAGFTQESAERHLSAFRTIIEASAQVIAEPERMLTAYGDYFLPIIDDLVERGEMERSEAIQIAKDALSELFVINQRLAFMVATEVADEIGAGPVSTKDMAVPIYRSNDSGESESLSKEEVMEELGRIMRQSGKESN